ncbi:Uncharacterised protein [Salmonella enterica subsp. enterica serovar Bovismorbificans]|uniref:Uncharacterized protein n=1 Tax=Salmonella enterica subsp. enterica serovar Bovismorbificans TaxID=58097 RepID=A0A655DY41_SALET|nr:Uncharacterised protein [Salmonella enterica subsp. enterica serovar Bovismorbificans]
MRLRRQARIIFRLFRQHRLFNKQRTIGFQFFNQHLRHRRANATVEIEPKLNFTAKSFADLRHGIDRRIHRTGVINHAHLFTAVQLEGVKTNTAQFFNTVNDVCRTIAAHPAIGLDFVAHQAAHELPDRRIQHLAFDIPQCLVNTGDGAHHNRAAAIKTGPVHYLPQVVDTRRIFPYQVVGKLMYCRLNSTCPTFNDRLSPANHAFIRFDFQEHPTWR